jgi:hypothetical protein
MAALDIATHGRIAISQKGNVAERKNFSKVRIEEWPGSHKVAHTPPHLAGRVVKGEAEISNDSLQTRFSPKRQAWRSSTTGWRADCLPGESEVSFNEDVLGIRTTETESLQDTVEQALVERCPRPDGTSRENRS